MMVGSGRQVSSGFDDSRGSNGILGTSRFSSVLEEDMLVGKLLRRGGLGGRRGFGRMERRRGIIGIGRGYRWGEAGGWRVSCE